LFGTLIFRFLAQYLTAERAGDRDARAGGGEHGGGGHMGILG
jgi:hypothetical protein